MGDDRLDLIILVFSDTCFESKYGRTLLLLLTLLLALLTICWCSEANTDSVIFHGPLLGCTTEFDTGLGRTATLGIVGSEVCRDLPVSWQATLARGDVSGEQVSGGRWIDECCIGSTTVF